MRRRSIFVDSMVDEARWASSSARSSLGIQGFDRRDTRGQAEGHRFVRVDEAAGEDQILDTCWTDEIDQTSRCRNRQAVTQGSRDRDTEARPHGAKAQIAGEGDRTATANRGPVDQSDGRTFYAFETIDGGVEAALVAMPSSPDLKSRNCEMSVPAAKASPAPRIHEHPQARRRVDLLADLDERVAHVPVSAFRA